jgi:LmbE family N-acetylglucosaminyl deacetylase
VQADPEEAIGRLVALMRELKPDVVITFEPFGWYGHPDHVAVSRLATDAYDLMADAAAYPETGQPWQPQRLYHAVLPVSMFQAMTDYAREHNLFENGDGNGFEPQDGQIEAEAQITHVLDMHDMLEIKQNAMWSHRTQFGEDNWFRKFPLDILQQMWGNEYFILVRPAPADELKLHHASELFA